MKKLYRIHSRYVLEVQENMNIDISGQLVDSKFRRGGNAVPLDQQREYGKKKRMVDPNNHLLSLFLNKNNISDFETVIENQMDRVNSGRNVIFLLLIQFFSTRNNAICFISASETTRTKRLIRKR